MVRINKTGEGYYLATPIISDEILSRAVCNQLKREVSQIIKAHREISIDIRGIKSINREGFKILQELQYHATQKRCKLKYINVDPVVYPNIAKLTEKKVYLENELESF